MRSLESASLPHVAPSPGSHWTPSGHHEVRTGLTAPGRELLMLGLEAEVVNAQSSRRIRGRPKRNQLDGRCGYDKKEESRAAPRFGSVETL